MTRKAFCSEMLEVKEIFVRLIVMVGFLLQIRLLQLIWSSRKDDTKQMDLWMAEKKVFYVIFTLHAAGLLITFLVHQNNTLHGDVVSSSGLSQLHTFWENLKSYSGLVLDGFLLPQILLNLFRNSKGNALSCAYDLFEALVYVDGSSLYEDEIEDYYSTAWDIIIPLVSLLFVVIIHLQQRFGGCDGRGPSTPFHEWQETSQKRLDPKERASRPSKTKLGASKTKLEASKTKLEASRTKLRASRTRRLGSSYEWKRGY